MAPTLTATRCPECSATLKVSLDAERLRCEYCGTTLSVEHKRPPRDPAQTRVHTIYLPRPMPIGARLTMMLGPLIPIVLVGNAFWPQLRALVPGLGNVLPVECPLNGRVALDGKTFHGSGTLIVAGPNCEISIKNSTLEGDAIIEGGVNLKIKIENSRLVAHKRAIATGANCQLSVVNKSEVRGVKTALDLGANAELKLDDSTVASEGIALRADANLSIEAQGGSIEGKPAIEASGYASRYELEGVKIVGAEKVKRRR